MVKRSRIIIMVTLVFVIIVGYAYRIMQFQITDGASYREKSTTSNVSTMPLIAARGQIFDRYGRVLATSKMSYNILIEKAFFPSFTNKTEQDSELLTLTGILKSAGETWEDSLPISTAAPYTYTGSKYKIKALIKYLNSGKSKEDALIPKDAPASAVMAALEKYFETSGYTEQQQRTLCGIRYSMVVNYYDYLKVYTFATGVSKDTVTTIAERSSSLPGAVAQQVPERSYPDGTVAPQVIGMTGRINEAELKEYGSSYNAEDSVGKSGIEKSMEKYLRGTNGTEEIEQNSSGAITNSTVTAPARAGDNVVLTLDKDLQKAVQDELPVVVDQIRESSYGDPRYGADVQGAAAVVMNIKTGEVLAMANYPSYDLNSYRKNYSSIASNPLNPLLDRGIAGTYRPGSTFKPITSTAGLMNGIITKNTWWNCPSEFDKYYPSYIGHDDEGTWRYVNVVQALSVSSNVFFNRLGDAIGMKRLESTATNIFGVGKETGIELGGEQAGSMSGYAYDAAHGKSVYPADAAQAGIGQLDTKLTPLQMANYVSILCRNGTQYQVHIVKQINSYDNTKVLVDNSTPTVKSKHYISQYVINTVKEGMADVTESGTASSVFSGFNMKIGGKTGTAQIGILESYGVRFNGVFIAFAPYNDPELAIAVVVEHGHFGFPTSPVAKKAITTYYNLNDYGYSKTTTASTTSVGTLLK